MITITTITTNKNNKQKQQQTFFFFLEATFQTSFFFFFRQQQNINYIVGFESHWSMVGGINVPKLIQCKSSDGHTFKQLVKGKDDLRQDAVMQQMFQVVNGLLKENTQTNRRQLRIKG